MNPRYIIVSLCILCFASCDKKLEQFTINNMPERSEIVDVIKTVIELDSLIEKETEVYSKIIEYTNVYSQNQCDTLNPPCPPPINYIFFNYISLNRENNKRYIPKSDSAYVNFQIQNKVNLILDSNELNNTKVVQSIDNFKNQILFYKPIFNKNRDLCFIKYRNFPAECEIYHTKVYLKKEKERWLIISRVDI